jgi:hypothetical protein
MFLQVSNLKTDCSKSGLFARIFPPPNADAKWRAPCFMSAMSKIAFTVDKKSGHIHPMLITADRARKTRLTLLDRVFIGFVLLVVAELIYLVVP